MGKSSEDKALEEVNNTVGFVEDLVGQLAEARVSAEDLTKGYLERMKFYKAQIERLSTTIEFVNKIVS